MAENEMDLIQRLSEENPRFRKLHEEHILFEKKLQEYEEMTYISDDEEMEIKKIKKLKLAGKEEMEAMLNEYRQ